MKRNPVIPKVRPRRSSGFIIGLIVAAGFLLLSLSLLTAEIFVDVKPLQIGALSLLGAAFLSLWLSILAWRIPILPGRTIVWFGIVWAIGIGISVWLILLTSRVDRSAAWEGSVDWLALTISFAVGGLFLRSLLRKRTSPLAARLISLLSPLAILLLILLLPR